MMNQINNMPTYATDYSFIVATRVDDTLWFYGAYHDMAKANKVALEIGSAVVVSNEKKPQHIPNDVADNLMNIIYGACERQYRQAYHRNMEQYELEQHMMFLDRMLCTD